MRSLMVFLASLAVSSATAQQGRWHVVPATAIGHPDGGARLVLEGTDRPFWPDGRKSADTTSAMLMIACGHTLPGQQGRTLFFSPGHPLEPFGNAGYARLRFDDEDWQQDTYLDLDGHSAALRALARRLGSLRLGFLGDDASPYYSSHLMRHLLESRHLTVTYRAFGEERRVIFELAGLSTALSQFEGCDWHR